MLLLKLEKGYDGRLRAGTKVLDDCLTHFGPIVLLTLPAVYKGAELDKMTEYQVGEQARIVAEKRAEAVPITIYYNEDHQVVTCAPRGRETTPNKETILAFQMYTKK